MKKKILKFSLIGGAVCILLMLGGFLFIQVRGIPTYPKPPHIDHVIKGTPERVEHGAKLSSMLCANCHRGEGNKLVGKRMMDAPPEFGEIYAPNITRDPVAGIGGWTDSELWYYLRTGVRSDGSYSPPYMPKFHLMSDEDLESIVAYLRSTHPTVEPKSTIQPHSNPSFLTKFLSQFAFKPMPFPMETIKTPEVLDRVEYGKYLVQGRYDCWSCHSASFESNDYLVPENSKGYLGGGNKVYNLDGEQVASANLTMDEETGLGKWSQEAFIKAIRTGQLPNGKSFQYPMVPYPLMTEDEAKAIWEYLETVPVISNEVD